MGSSPKKPRYYAYSVYQKRWTQKARALSGPDAVETCGGKNPSSCWSKSSSLRREQPGGVGGLAVVPVSQFGPAIFSSLRMFERLLYLNVPANGEMEEDRSAASFPSEGVNEFWITEFCGWFFILPSSSDYSFLFCSILACRPASMFWTGAGGVLSFLSYLFCLRSSWERGLGSCVTVSSKTPN
ncbi:hypothetical protein LY78DRAFT_251254 [Colletotrichum sublineola]|nr:hypothetical protein LY78DRAFT_251254 [Colletotrichum sublineola]